VRLAIAPQREGGRALDAGLKGPRYTF
jgi:hypothetical protein